MNASPVSIRGLASKSTKKDESDPDLNRPINYLESPAAQWKAQWSTKGIKSERPWFETYIVLGCVTAFMLYFCVLREENDIDEHLKMPLYSNVPGMEESNLLTTYKFNKEHGKDNREVEKRMKELGMDLTKIQLKN